MKTAENNDQISTADARLEGRALGYDGALDLFKVVVEELAEHFGKTTYTIEENLMIVDVLRRATVHTAYDVAFKRVVAAMKLKPPSPH